MHQRILFLFMLLISIHFSGLSQSHPTGASILIGKKIKDLQQGNLQSIIGSDQSGYYVLRSNHKKIFLKHYSNQLNHLKNEELNLGKGRNEREYEFILQMNEQLYLFSSFDDSKSKQNILYVQQINKATLKPEANLRKIAAMDYSRKKNDGTYGYKLAADSSHILIYYNSPYEKDQFEKFSFHVLDKQMNLKWQKDGTLPYNDGLFGIERYRVDSKGNVYILGRLNEVKPKEKLKGLGLPDYDYHVLAYMAQGNTFSEYKVNLKQNFITDIQIAVKEDGDLIVSGFYSESGPSSTKGTFFVTLDANSKQVSKTTLQQFDKDFVKEFMNGSKEEDQELQNFNIDKLILRPDGGAILIAEKYYTYTSISFDNTTHNTGYRPTSKVTNNIHYNYDDLMVVNIRPNGTIEWAKKIPKSQESNSDRGFYSSYMFFMQKDTMCFIFNDHKKNLLANGSDKTHRLNTASIDIGTNLVVVMVKLDARGESHKEALFNIQQAGGVIIRAKVSDQINPNEIILIGYRKSLLFGNLNIKQRFVKLTLN